MLIPYRDEVVKKVRRCTESICERKWDTLKDWRILSCLDVLISILHKVSVQLKTASQVGVDHVFPHFKELFIDR